jgi:colicin import membrane protein
MCLLAPAPLGHEGANAGGAARMSAAQRARLDGLIGDQYRRCWNIDPIIGARHRVVQIRVEIAPDGSLAAEPVLLHPATDPAGLRLAQSAMWALRLCSPLQVPAEFAPYHGEWQRRIIRFDPATPSP